MYEEKEIKSKIKEQKKKKEKKKKHNRHYKNRFFFFIEEKNGRKYINFNWGQIALRTFIFIVCIILFIIIGITTIFTNRSNNNVFNENIKKLEDVALTYYNVETLPEQVDDSISTTLKELITEGYIENLVDKKGNTCEEETSYIILTKISDTKYTLKTHLNCGNDNATLEEYLICEDECKIEK